MFQQMMHIFCKRMHLHLWVPEQTPGPLAEIHSLSKNIDFRWLFLQKSLNKNKVIWSTQQEIRQKNMSNFEVK